MSRPLESDLLERMVASVIVAVGTRYVVEVERELLMLRMQVLEKGCELGNVEVLDSVSERLARVSNEMQGISGEVQRVLTEVRRELSRLNFGGAFRSESESPEKGRRGRPPKSGSSDCVQPRPSATDNRL